MKKIHAPIFGTTRSGRPMVFKSEAMSPHPNPRELDPSEFVGNGKTLKQLLRNTPVLQLNNSHDVVLRSYDGNCKTQGGYPAVTATTVSQNTASKRPPEEHKCFVIGLDKALDKPLKVNWAKMTQFATTYSKRAWSKLYKINKYKQHAFLVGMANWLDSNLDEFSREFVIKLTTFATSAFPKVEHKFDQFVSGVLNTRNKRKFCAAVAAFAEQASATYSSDIGKNRIEPICEQKRVVVICSCEWYCFVLEYANTVNGCGRILYSNGEPAVVKNPRNSPGLCKHLVRVANEILKLRD